MLGRPAALAGSALWFLVAPGSLVVLLPWLVTGWHADQDLGSASLLPFAGVVLSVAGAIGLIESFARFALDGRATPAPVTPTRKLIVGGFYRHVRNPMYVSVLAVITGEALVLGQAELLAYAGILWAILHLIVVLREEPAMRLSFSREYADYSGAVRRWIPRIRPWTACES